MCICQVMFLLFCLRPIMEASDVALAAILAIVGALTSKALGVMAGVAAGAAYLLWKAGSWKPAEEIIQARNFMPCTRLSKRGARLAFGKAGIEMFKFLPYINRIVRM